MKRDHNHPQPNPDPSAHPSAATHDSASSTSCGGGIDEVVREKESDDIVRRTPITMSKSIRDPRNDCALSLQPPAISPTLLNRAQKQRDEEEKWVFA
ncbi:hypothetical protein GOBAR_DD15557 [Gossypium barbadense]|nr:hypothetical protein GOBAR_DD15557 [Gossypium barbadense]